MGASHNHSHRGHRPLWEPLSWVKRRYCCRQREKENRGDARRFVRQLVSCWNACHCPSLSVSLPELECVNVRAGVCHCPSWSVSLLELQCVIDREGVCHCPSWSVSLPELVCVIARAGVCHCPSWSVSLPELECVIIIIINSIRKYKLWLFGIQNLVILTSQKCPNYVTASGSNSILDQLTHLRAQGIYHSGGVPDSAMEQS